MNFVNDRQAELKLRRKNRFRFFSIPEISEKFEIYGQIKPIFLALFLTIFVFVILIFFTEYKDFALKSGIFALFFSGYKIYRFYTEPILKLDHKGFHLQNIFYKWSDIKKVEPTLNKNNIDIHFRFKNNLKKTETIENVNIYNYLLIINNIRYYKKKFRNFYRYENQKKN